MVCDLHKYEPGYDVFTCFMEIKFYLHETSRLLQMVSLAARTINRCTHLALYNVTVSYHCYEFLPFEISVKQIYALGIPIVCIVPS